MAMTLAEFLRMMPGYLISKEQMAYARYLEQEGLRFLIDFGFENAEDIAWYRLEREHQCHLDRTRFILGHA